MNDIVERIKQLEVRVTELEEMQEAKRKLQQLEARIAQLETDVSKTTLEDSANNKTVFNGLKLKRTSEPVRDPRLDWGYNGDL